MKTKIIKIAFLALIVLLAGSASANNCGFYRDLGQGSRGEDVRCLQAYLQSTGYSYGNADGVFGPLTRQAVISWQVGKGIFPANGYFDAVSRAKYYGTSTIGSVLGASTTTSYYNNTTTTNTYSMGEQARMAIEDTIEKIEDARDEIDDSNFNTSEAEDSLEMAYDDIFDAMRAYFVGDYEDAKDFADDAMDNAEDAEDEADGSTGGNMNDAQDAIEDAEDAINDAEDEIEEARDDGIFVGLVEDMLDDAEDLLDDAEDEYDDRDYDDAEDSAEEAEDIANEIMDILNLN
jgi:peptidoglycan hydrolase-like protein with peptidoglycan-binding domain